MNNVDYDGLRKKGLRHALGLLTHDFRFEDPRKLSTISVLTSPRTRD